MSGMQWHPDSSPNYPEITICDINESMLEVGRQRAEKRGYYHPHPHPQPRPDLKFVQDDAEVLKNFSDNSQDIYTIAFGIRNVTNLDKALQSAHRVLRKGGRFMCLEFSQVTISSVFASVYDAYSFNVIPKLGQIVANDRESYQVTIISHVSHDYSNTCCRCFMQI